MLNGIVGWFGSADKFRRGLEIAVLLSGIVLLVFIGWITLRVAGSNARSDIAQILAPIVSFALLAIGLAVTAAVVDRNERRHELEVATAGTPAGGAPAVVPTKPWRGSAFAGLAILAFSLSLISSSQLGRLRSSTDFMLRDKHNVPQCMAWACDDVERGFLTNKCKYSAHDESIDPHEDTPDSEIAKLDAAYRTWVDQGRIGTPPKRYTYGHDCFVYVHQCAAKLLAPTSATTNDQVAIDLSVSCPDAPPQRMPLVDAHYFGEPSGSPPPPEVIPDKGPTVHNSFASAKTLMQNARTWRWFVRYPSGQQPLDIKLTFLGDTMVIPYKRINVSEPTTIAGLQQYTTAIGGLLGALVGLFGTIGSLLKGIRGHSSTVVTTTPADAAADTPPEQS
jgi:hypothetical protein